MIDTINRRLIKIDFHLFSIYQQLVTWNIATFGCAVAKCNEVNSSYTQFPDLGLYYLACEYYAPLVKFFP